MIVLIIAGIRIVCFGAMEAHAPFVLTYPSVILAALFGGISGGLVATAMAGFLTSLWLEPVGSFAMANDMDRLAMGIFLISGAAISFLIESAFRTRTRVGDALRKSEEQFRLLVQQVRDYAIFMIDTEGLVISWNAGAEHIKGYRAEEIVGHHMSCLYTPEDNARGLPARLLRRAAAEGRSEDEGWRVRKDGSRFWANVVVTALYNSEGKLRGFSKVTRDVTEQRRMESDLLHAKEEWERTFDSVPDLIAIMDTNHRLTRVNRAMARQLGTSPEKIIGAHCYNLAHGSDLPPHFCPHTQLLRDGKEHVVEVHEERLGGDYLLTVTPLRDAEDQILGSVHVLRDISERKRMVAELRQSRDELELRVRERTAQFREANQKLLLEVEERKRVEGTAEAERQRFFHVLETLPVYVCLLTPDHQVSFANRVFRERFGESRGLRCYEHLFGRSEPCEACDTYKVLDTKAPHQWDWTGPDKRNYNVFDFPFTDTDGSSLILEMGIDVTERMRAETELRATVSRLGLLNVELQEFAFVASHDLQEPLRKIQTFSDMAKKRCTPPLDSTGQQYLDRVITSAGRMRQLLDDLLQFSRVVTRPEPFEKVDLNRLVREAVDVFEQQIMQTGAKIEIQELPSIEVDASQLLRLFQNMIGNALKFRNKDRNPFIKIYAEAGEQDSWDIFVEDNGIGFEQQFAETIFKPFQRLHGRKEYEGTGIGLAICRKIAEQHGGSIRVRSGPGKGSKFILKLPGTQTRMKTSGTE